MKNHNHRISATDKEVIQARNEWMRARTEFIEIAELFKEGSGFGDPNARKSAEKRMDIAKFNEERLFLFYNELERKRVDLLLLTLQKSQNIATWASFAIAAMVGIATIVNIIVNL